MAEVPTNVPYALLECEAAWSKLSKEESLYAHHMSMASWYGAVICLHQTSYESFAIFEFLMGLFSLESGSLSAVEQRLRTAGASEEDVEHSIQYAAHFFGNMGNYLSFGDSKFIPRIPKDKLKSIVSSLASENLNQLLNQCVDKMYSMTPKEAQLGLDEHGVSSYYGEDISRADIERSQAVLQHFSFDPLNTRLMKKAEQDYELRVASANISATPLRVLEHNGSKVTIVDGDFSHPLSNVVKHLKEAQKYAANDIQRKMLDKYIAHFETGDVDGHYLDSQRLWVQDKGPVVETNIGFVETYRDPQGVRAEWEGLVAVVNKEMSLRFAALVDQAETFLARLPWPRNFEKDKFLRPDFTSLEVVAFASSGVPAGINIPNSDKIRQSEGFKNVSLGNVLSSRNTVGEKVTFLRDEDQELFQKLMGPSFEVQVAGHELLGHGSGKIFSESADGKRNFDLETVISPLTNEPIKSWYKAGESYDGVFKSLSSAMEECRAECVGILLSCDEDMLKLFGHTADSAEAADDVMYVNWLLMCRAGLVGLEFYTAETKKWRQAHMQARFAIFKTLLAAGEGLVFVRLTGENGDAEIVLDRSKIKSVGVPAIRKLLQRIQVYRATADVEAAVALFDQVTTPNALFLGLRSQVLEKKKPRKSFVQVHTRINAESGAAEVQNFAASPRGMIESMLARYGQGW